MRANQAVLVGAFLALVAACGGSTVASRTTDAGSRGPGAGADAGSGVCALLSRCCPSLPAGAQPSASACASTAAGGDSAGCEVALDDLESDGYCVGTTPAGGTDGGSGSGSAGGSGSGAIPPECASLGTCCQQMVAAPDTSECELVVSMGSGSTCGNALADFVNEGLCTGTGPDAGSGSGTGG